MIPAYNFVAAASHWTQNNSGQMFQQYTSNSIMQSQCEPKRTFMHIPNNHVTVNTSYNKPALKTKDANIFILPAKSQASNTETKSGISAAAKDAMMPSFQDNCHHPYPNPEEYRSFVATAGTTYSQAVK